MKKALGIICTLVLLAATGVGAQVGINADNALPDSSAMLDVQSTNKGFLVPRMTTTQRDSILNPATGLLVYVNTDSSFYYFDGTTWLQLTGGTISALADADNDTKIQVEESADEDKIRFDTDGTERMVIRDNGKIGIGQSTPAWPTTVRSDENIFSAGDTIDPTKFALTVVNGDGANNEGVGIGLGKSSNGGQAGAGIVFQKTGTNSLGKLMFTIKSDGTTNGPQTPALTILPFSGRVGIGTTTPGDQLHVEGAIRMVDGNEAAGYIPVASDNGKMTWTDPGTVQTDTLSVIADADNDTKIQVENNPDEDIIRFKLGGTEHFRMVGGRMVVAGTSSNYAYGSNSTLSDLTTGTANVVFGQGLHNVTSGSSNVALGVDAGAFVTTGDNNTFLGRQAGYSLQNGSGNVFLGYRAGFGEAGASNKLFIENTGSGSPLIYGEFDNDIVGINGDLGIGTHSPADELHVEGSIRMVDGNQAAGYIPDLPMEQ